MSKATDTAGSRTSPRAIQTGVLTQTDTGRTQITAGRGSATRILAGLRTTTVIGVTSRITAGSGFREPISIGGPHGSHGGLAAITLAGGLCLLPARGLLMRVNRSAPALVVFF